MIGGHPGGEVGGGFVVGLGLMAAPFHEQAVGQAGENAMHPDGVTTSQAALIVAAGDIKPGVQAVLNAPVLAVELEPAGRGQLLRRTAGHQGYGFGWVAIDFAAQARGLGGQGEASLLGGDRGGVDGAGFRAAFVAFVGAGQRR